MTIEEYQKQVDDWIRAYGVRYFDVKTNTLILMEEVGEFARIVARVHGEQSFKKTPDNIEEELKNEIGDILFVITCLANQMNLDLQAVIDKNFQKKNQRDQERHFNNPKLKE